MIEELDPDTSAISGEEVGFVPAEIDPCPDCPDEPWVCVPSGGTVVETVDFTVANNARRITHMQGFFPSGPADDSYDSTAAGPFVATKPWAFIASTNNGGDTDYEQEARGFASCITSFPGTATHAHVTSVLYGRTIATPPGYAIDLHYSVYAGTWGAATATWTDIGTLITSGTITPDSTASVALDFTIPLVSGYGQFVIAFDDVLTTHVNADPIGIHSADRYPALLPADGQVMDEIRIHHPSFTTTDTSHLYKMEFITALCTDDARVDQRVREDLFIGDGSTTSFTTRYPYLPQSLKVTVNGLNWTTSGVTETDPTTNAYDVTPPFPLGSDVQVGYRRAS